MQFRYATEELPFGEPLNVRSAWEVRARAAICPVIVRCGVPPSCPCSNLLAIEVSRRRQLSLRSDEGLDRPERPRNFLWLRLWERATRRATVECRVSTILDHRAGAAGGSLHW